MFAQIAAFQGEEHQSFLLVGGRPAALLVHGFPGSPAEMRPVGEALHDAGWTVQGLLLPGFGPDIATLQQRRLEDWQAAVANAMASLRREHDPLLLVGLSMGGALALQAAADTPPDGLILLAPFWRLAGNGAWLQLLWPAIRVIFPVSDLFALSNPTSAIHKCARAFAHGSPKLISTIRRCRQRFSISQFQPRSSIKPWPRPHGLQGGACGRLPHPGHPG